MTIVDDKAPDGPDNDEPDIGDDWDYDKRDYMTDPARCKLCGYRLDRPSYFRCEEHSPMLPTPALAAVFAVHDVLADRRLGWRDLDDDLIDEIDDAVAKALEPFVKQQGGTV